MQSGNSLWQTVHTHHASVHQAAKLVASVLRVARVTAGLAESNGSLPPGLETSYGKYFFKIQSKVVNQCDFAVKIATAL